MMMKAAIQNAFSGNKKAYLVFSFINYMKSDGSHEMLVIRDESTLPNNCLLYTSDAADEL